MSDNTPADDLLERVLVDVAFAAPVTIEDCTQVRDALREHFPTEKIEVYCHQDVDVIVQVGHMRKYLRVQST